MQARFPYIDRVHLNDFARHISVDVIVLDTTDGPVELLTAMIDLNK
jgi:hypothetical protein